MPEWPGLTPHNTISLGLGVILIAHRRHLAVEPEIGRPGRRGTDGAQQPRRAQPAKECRVARVLREQAVGAAIGAAEDRLATKRRAHLAQLGGDDLERLVPIDAFERARALSALAARRGAAADRRRTLADRSGEPWRRCSRW